MNRINELIKEYCPDGVPFQKIKDVYTRVKGTPITAGKMKEIACDNGEIRIFAGGKTIIDAHEKDIPKANITRVPAVLVQSRGVIDVVYYDKPFTFKNEMWAYTSKDIVSVKFLYYVLKNSIQTFRDAASGMGSLPQISLKVTEEFMLPVPPLEVQREIVHILDSFTLLTAELTAELTARKKQYNFYRDTLIQKEHKSKKVKLNTICEIYDGTHQTPKYTNSGIPFVSVENIDDLYGTQKFISPEAYAKYKIKPRIGDVFMTRITAGVIGKCTVVDRDDDLAYYVSLALLRPNADILDSKYLKYYLESGWGRKELSKWILWDATPTKINKDDIGRVLISVPPLDTQKRLVQVIEYFDAICTDLNIGLPAEIEARQKQYEYYRDLLLTFAETGSMIVTDRQTDRAERN